MTKRESSAVQLTADTIGDLDGGSAKFAIDAAIRSAIRDVEDRGEDGKARDVTIKLTFKNENGPVSIACQVAAKIPNYSTKKTISVLHDVAGKPTLKFQPATPQNPNQEEYPIPAEAE